jgi:(R,R)-butanediol dehydrogenase/meso-butanediol dehydrogenase/diacetyl reductase
MKAARFHARRDVRVEEVAPPPDDLGPHEVLVRNRLCGICGTDLHEYAHGPIFVPQSPHPFSGAQLPQILGHEFGGVVVAVGSDVRDTSPGDRVAIQPHMAPPDDYYVRRGLTQLSEQLAIVGLSAAWGGFADYAVVNDYNAVPIPDGVTDEQAALIEPAAVALHAVERAGVRPGDSVLVVGAGPIGQLQVMAARAAGATLIFLADINDSRLVLARTILGDIHTVNPLREDLLEMLRDLTVGHIGVDVAFECVGQGRALGSCIAAVRPQGVVVQVGLHVGPAEIDAYAITRKDIDLRGSWCYSTLMWPRVAAIFASGIMQPELIVTKRVTLDAIVQDGFEALLDPAGDQLKILVEAEV